MLGCSCDAEEEERQRQDLHWTVLAAGAMPDRIATKSADVGNYKP